MATTRLAEQELVAHVFAPLTGSNVEDAHRQVRDLWENCRDQLGMSRAIVETGLTTRLPDDPHAWPDGALAGLQDPAADFQAIARRQHDVLNVSLVMATPLAMPRRRRGIGSIAPPGWPEFARWWSILTAGGTGALLGVTTVYQAKHRSPADANVRDLLPAQDDDGTSWWTAGHTVEGFQLWEISPGDDRAQRRLVVVARPYEDARLSRFTWSSGDAALPPLGRYLMHAAKLRYQSRVRGDGRQLARLRDRVIGRMDRLTDALHDPTTTDAARAEDAAGLAADEATLAATLANVRSMRRTIEIAYDNMTSALATPLPSDAALGERLRWRLADDTEYLDTTHEHARRLRGVTGAWPPALAVPPALAGPPASAPTDTESAPACHDQFESRLGFGINVVDLSRRSVPRQVAVRERIAALVEQVLADIGVRLHDTDRQIAGDGLKVVLPAGLHADRVLPALLYRWRARLAEDNAANPGDRARIRLSVAAGPMSRTTIGLTEKTIVDIARALDSGALRAAAAEHRGADVVAVISNQLFRDVVGEGHTGLDSREFEAITVEAKDIVARAWLWTGGAAPTIEPVAAVRASPPTPPAQAETAARGVFVIHGRDEEAARAVFGLLRDLDLRPLEWEEIVARTGETTPMIGDVLEQAFAENQAAIVVLTPEDAVKLHPSLARSDEDAYDGVLMGQALPSVLFQAGMALGLQGQRTLVVEIGRPRPFSDLDGRDVVRFTADTTEHLASLKKVAQRLSNAGCALNRDGEEWLDTTRFRGLAAYTRTFVRANIKGQL